MTKKKSFLITFFFSLFLIFSFLTIRSFADVSAPRVLQDVYVYDQADILSDETEESVNRMLYELEEKTSAEVAVITISSLGENSLENYVNRLFNNLGIGKKEKDNGVLLLIAAEEEKVRLEMGRGLEDVLTDSISGRILDNYFVPYRDENNYDQAVYLTASAVSNKIALNCDATLDNTDSEATVSNELPIFYKIIIALVIIVMTILFFVDRELFWIIVFSFLNCSGGFSGGRSGGSFGGGSSGGGGASR